MGLSRATMGVYTLNTGNVFGDLKMTVCVQALLTISPICMSLLLAERRLTELFTTSNLITATHVPPKTQVMAIRVTTWNARSHRASFGLQDGDDEVNCANCAEGRPIPGDPRTITR